MSGGTVHHLGALSGNAYLLYYRVTGEAKWREKAARCFRNLLSLYRPDGFGSAAYFIVLLGGFAPFESGDVSIRDLRPAHRRPRLSD